MYSRDKRSFKSESGQTLILSVFAMLILLMAIVFLFDIHNIIRLKMKAQTAVDSAAITAADWQKTSLNLIGELNIIKACTVLVSDIQPLPTSTSDLLLVTNVNNPSAAEIEKLNQDIVKLQKKSDLLTEMQARIAFVGPLIGFGAAQQAAKNNGLNYNHEYGSVVSKHLSRLLNDDTYGGSVINQYVPDMTQEKLDADRKAYCWREPYINMLNDILGSSMSSGEGASADNKGIAVAPNTQYLGAPRLTSDPPDFIAYLQDKNIYRAINANYWCYIRVLLRMDYSATKWWGDIVLLKDTASFPKESEYIPINIDFMEGTSPYSSAAVSLMAQPRNYTPLTDVYDGVNTYLKDANGNIQIDPDTNKPIRNPGDPDATTDKRMNPLPYINWAIYASGWWSSYPDISDTWDIYLYGKIKSEYRYYGAVAKMATMIYPPTISGSWRKLSEMAEKKDRSDLTGKYLGNRTAQGGVGTGGATGMGSTINTYADRLKNAEETMQSSLEYIVSSALAKPFGRIPLADGSYRTPVATRMVLPVFEKAALIPVSLEDPGGFDPFDYQWYAFLTEYLPTLGESENLGEMPAKMAAMYTDHWNSGWFAPYHSALVKLNTPEWRQQGIDWLEYNNGHKPIYGDEFNPTLITGYTPDDFNEDHCDDWYGTGPGPRTGPSITH